MCRHGPPRVAEERADFPFAVAAPQCPSGQTWVVERLAGTLDLAMGRCPCDPDRVYLTGLSMGGYGAWALGADQAHRFAAVVPICGGGDPHKVGLLRRVPVWAFHGARDPVVPCSASRVLVDALRRCGGDVRLTVYEDGEHDVWTRAYSDPELYEWLLGHRRPRALRGRQRSESGCAKPQEEGT